MSGKGAGLLIAAVAVSVIFALQKIYLKDSAVAGSPDPAPSVKEQTTEPAKSTQAVLDTNDRTDTVDKISITEPVPSETPVTGLSEEILATEREAFFKRFDLATSLGDNALSDGDFNAVVAYLKNDRTVLLEQFLQQYRENTEPARAKRLAQILEAFDDETITAVAEDLVFSGELNSQKAGLDLLADQQVKNPAARELVSQVLVIESNPEVLVSALNALAKPGLATDEQTDRLLNQFVLHSSSEDETVRSHSLTLMGR